MQKKDVEIQKNSVILDTENKVNKEDMADIYRGDKLEVDFSDGELDDMFFETDVDDVDVDDEEGKNVSEPEPEKEPTPEPEPEKNLT